MAEGERLYPSFEDINYPFHLFRYLWAAPFAYASEVLDAGCGAGYGAEILSLVASRVHGVDYDSQVVARNRLKYSDRSNLSFEVQDLAQLTLPDQSFDLIVSFEVYEHMAPEAGGPFLMQLCRVCRPGGTVLLSTPNRLVEGPFMRSTGQSYRYHINSVSPGEFKSHLRRHFGSVQLLGQRVKAPPVKRVLRALDVMNIRHHLLSFRGKERIEKALTGHRLAAAPSLSAIEIAASSVRQAGITIAVCHP